MQRVVRFPLRALLALTTAVALVAAAAGPVFRGVTLEGVARILVACMAPLGMTAFLYARHRKDASRLHRGVTVRLVVLHCVRYGGWRRWFLPSLGGALIVAWVGASSYLAAFAFEGINAALHLSVWQGIAMAWLVFSISQRPLFLCEEWIPLKRKLLVPWHWIHGVEAVERRPNVMRLRRWAGDIYLEVPDEQRRAVEAFLAEKIPDRVYIRRGLVESQTDYFTVAMNEELTPPSLDPVLRFRLRTLLWVTTALAALAAIAGPFYRAAPLERRAPLLLLWSIILLMTAASYYLRLREAVGRSRGRQVKFVVFQTGMTGAAIQRAGMMLFTVPLVLLWTGFVSYLIAFDSAAMRSVGHGIGIGSAAAGIIFSFSKRPLFFCDEGIPLAKGHVVPWRYIRYAEPVTGRPGAMKLRRFDGDIYVELPAQSRAAIQAFLREKVPTIKDLDHGCGPTGACIATAN